MELKKGEKIGVELLSVVLVAVLAAGTIVEKYHGNEFATTHIYGAWWFFLLMALVGIFAIYAIVKQRLWHTPYRLMLYGSVVLMLAGGALTAETGSHGSLTLQPGVPINTYTTDKGNTVELPFSLTLERFEVESYPGTHTPMDFVSRLSVDGTPVVVSMNNILRRDGYRFYQEDYDEAGNSTLSVAHDPWGIGFTYAGYLLMGLGIVLLLLSPQSRFRQLMKPTAVVLLLLVGIAAATAGNTPKTLPKATADKMGRMYVLYKGRVCPLQTLAKDFTTKLYGKANYKGLSPEQVFSGWVFYFSEWEREPMIKVKGDDVRKLLGVDGAYACYDDFLQHPDVFQQRQPMGGNMGAMPGANSTMQSKNLRAAGEKYSPVQMLSGGKMPKLFPVADSTGALGWYAQNDDLPFNTPDDDYFFIRKQLSYCQELVVSGDYKNLESVFEKTLKYQQIKGAQALPSVSQYQAERLYNKLTTGRWLPMVLLFLGLLSFVVTVFRSGRGGKGSQWVEWSAFVVVSVVTLFLILIFALRWIAGGHIPMAGGFDSMNLMSIAIGVTVVAMAAITKINFRNTKTGAIVPSGLLAIGFCQLVAMMSGSNPPMTHLMPVLSSPLLTLHVTVIMISYALFFIVMLNGIGGLLMPHRAEEAKRTGLLMLYPAVMLLAIGIVIGALWANISWGNYWSWDPKEVWALITLIIYLNALLLFRDGSRLRGFHLFCVLAFFSVIVTYFGVNFLLGGIHAYN